MKRKPRIVVVFGLLLIVWLVAAFAIVGGLRRALRFQDLVELVIPDARKSGEARADTGPLYLAGAFYVVVTGRVDGTGNLHIYCNHDRFHEVAPLAGPVQFQWGGAEMWVDDLHVKYEPVSVKGGELVVKLYAGTGPGYARSERAKAKKGLSK